MATDTPTYWDCLVCRRTSNKGERCARCGRARSDATDARRWRGLARTLKEKKQHA